MLTFPAALLLLKTFSKHIQTYLVPKTAPGVWKQISAITIWNLTATEYLVLKYFILKNIYLNLFALNSPLWNYFTLETMYLNLFVSNLPLKTWILMNNFQCSQIQIKKKNLLTEFQIKKIQVDQIWLLKFRSQISS